LPAFSRFLRYFVAVGQTGSIRRAGDQLHVSPSAIDRQILAAEKELGAALFERLPTGLRLTSAGEVLMASALRWRRGLSEVKAHIEDLIGLRRGHVEIALIDALAKGVVPALLKQIQVDYPGITFGIHVLDNIEIVEAIRSAQVDFGLVLEPRDTRDIAVHAHVKIPLGFATLPGHPLANAAGQRFSACAGHRLIVPAPPLALAEHMQTLKSVSGTQVDVAASCDNIEMIKSLIHEGIGASVLTSIDLLTELKSGSLAFTPIVDDVARPLTLALCVSSPRQLSVASNLLLGEMLTAFRSLSFRAAAASNLMT
jgi:DNA-binding transcriptional LysR family regulator